MYGLLRISGCFISLREQCYSLQGENSEYWQEVKDTSCYAWSSFTSQSEHPAPTDNHQFTATQLLVTSTKLNCLVCSHARVIIHNLLSKPEEYISGGRDIPELSLSWTPAWTVCLSHGQQGRAGIWGNSTAPSGEQGSWGQPQSLALDATGTSALGRRVKVRPREGNPSQTVPAPWA